MRRRARRRSTMTRLLYTAILYCAAPYFLLRLLWRGLRNAADLRRIGERFGLGGPIGTERGCVWVHAVSVGEVQAAAPIVKALKNAIPDETIVVTSTTPTGAARVSKAFGGGGRPSLLPVRPFPAPWRVPGPPRTTGRDHHGDRDLAEPAGGVPSSRSTRGPRQRASLGALRGGLPEIPPALRAGAWRCRGDRGAERRGRPPDRIAWRTAGRHRRDRQHEVRRSDARERARGGGGAAAHAGVFTRRMDRGEHA